MTYYRGIQFEQHINYLCTRHLFEIIGHEIKVLIQNQSCEDYIRFLKYFIDYVIDHQPKIEQGQTMAYDCWVVKFEKVDDLYFTIWEVKNDGVGFVEGISYASKIINDQIELCSQFGVAPLFSQFNQKIVISKGVYEGLGVDAVRYTSPEHMTGWWVTTDVYDEKIESLMTVHFCHVAFHRPELLKYFALPFGFRFYLTKNEEDIWFDEYAVD